MDKPTEKEITKRTLQALKAMGFTITGDQLERILGISEFVRKHAESPLLLNLENIERIYTGTKPNTTVD